MCKGSTLGYARKENWNWGIAGGEWGVGWQMASWGREKQIPRIARADQFFAVKSNAMQKRKRKTVIRVCYLTPAPMGPGPPWCHQPTVFGAL